MFTHQKKHPELFALSSIAALIALCVQRWIEHSVTIFANANGLPLSIAIIGLALGMTRSNLHTKHISIAFFLMSCTLLFMDLNTCAQAFSNIPYLELISAFSALTFGSFYFSLCVGARFKELFDVEDFRCWSAISFGFFWGFTVFALTSGAGSFPPLLQLIVAALLLTALSLSFWRPAGLHVVCLLISGAVLVGAWKTETTNDVFWSVYHRFAIEPRDHNALSDGLPVLLDIDRTLQEYRSPVETSTEQAPTTNSPTAKEAQTNVSAVNKDNLASRSTFFKLPYLGTKPNYVLVLGSGLGEDITEALKAGAEYVDAVEGDPVLLEFGKAHNKSYESPRVHVINADPRNYANNCEKKYDAVILHCLNVQKNATTLARLQYVSLYTKDSYRKCLNLLNPNGELSLSCAAADDTDANLLCQRFYATTKQAFSEKIEIIGGLSSGWSPYQFRLNKTPQKPLVLREISPFSNVIFGPSVKYPILSDDFPYVCLRSTPLAITCLSLFVIAITAIGFAPSGSNNELEHMARDRQSLLIATGLSLVVSGTINRCELLLGTVWWISAIAYGAILFLAWLIIQARIDMETSRIELFLYPTLLASLLISFLLPIHWLSKWGVFGLAIIFLLTVLPLLRILLILPTISAPSKSLQRALVFNLLGLGLGILLQPAALILGNNSLLLLAFVAFVIAAYLDIKFGNKLAKVEKPPMKRIT